MTLGKLLHLGRETSRLTAKVVTRRMRFRSGGTIYQFESGTTLPSAASLYGLIRLYKLNEKEAVDAWLLAWCEKLGERLREARRLA